MLSPDYYNKYNGLAATQHSKDFLITYCLTLTLIVICEFLLFTYFKDSIFWTLLCILDNIHWIRLYTAHIFNTLFRLYTILNELQQLQIYDQRFQQPEMQKVLTQIPPLLDEFITEVREQLTIFPSKRFNRNAVNHRYLRLDNSFHTLPTYSKNIHVHHQLFVTTALLWNLSKERRDA